MSRSGLRARPGELLAHSAFAVVAGLLLVASAQPLQTDDTWWHLALGRTYAREGPRLAADPLLHTAAGPPDPSAWLADLGLYGIGSAGGFPALRIAHALVVAGILALAWSLLHRASRSRSGASIGATAFAALAAYRLFQLRPELLSVLATLALFRWLLEEAAAPSRVRVALAVLCLGVWANSHAGFLLGPILLSAALAGLILAVLVAPRASERVDAARARRLAWALGCGLLATFVNPSGVTSHLAYLRAGAETPDLSRVTDEWARLALFRLPTPNLPPSPLAWLLVWTLLVLVAPIAIHGALRWRRGATSRADDASDPALVAVAVASLAALLLAVRFLWLGIFPLLLVARAGRAGLGASGGGRRAVGVAAAVAGPALAVLFVRLGDWPMISGVLPRSRSGFAQDYPAAKYHAHAVWMLDDAELQGNLFNDYYMGGFLGYWLAPELRGFVNGTLNVAPEALAAYGALGARSGLAPGVGFVDLLDRYRVDLFLGVRTPQAPRPGRPRIYTTGHLEAAPGWIPVFRDLRSSVYLRSKQENRANLDRVARYYARNRVPFDRERGFDPGAVLRAAPRWAVEHGLVPVDFAALQAVSRGTDRTRRDRAIDRLASLYVALGLYEDAIAADRLLLSSRPGAQAARRRIVWSLLRRGRTTEALEEAEAIARAPSGSLARAIASAARRAAELRDEDDTAELLAGVPVFTHAEADRLMVGVVDPPARAWRR